MNSWIRNICILAVAGMAILMSTTSFAAKDCPVGLVNNLTLNDEFGPGTSAITRCIKERDEVKVVYQINKECKDAACTKPYAIGNINNAIKDYEITHGMNKSQYKIVAIVHSGGWKQILDNNSANPHAAVNKFQSQMEKLIASGVKVYFCQNTARSKGVKTDQLIKGVKYVTAGVTAIADFQLNGYAYVQP